MTHRTIFAAAACLVVGLWTTANLRAQQNAVSTNEPPSAELIIDAETDIAPEAPMAPGEEPLPDMNSPLPGEENIFGSDLFGTPGAVSQPSEPVIPERPPLLEDPIEAERKMRVKFRKVKAVLDSDPQLVELEQMADTAATPEDHRAARRAYYALFFSKVRKSDPKLADYADRLEALSLSDLYQTRIEPTVPLNPPPQPQPQAKFITPSQLPGEAPPSEERP